MSALVASPAKQDKVQVLQRTLYRAAKADPGRRFHALYDKVHRRDVLERAWWLVRRNDGAPGIDQVTIEQVEEYGVDRLLDELAAELRSETFKPMPARRVYIPKPGRLEQRPLSIPSIRDRVVQAALKIVLEPVFEADMLPCSFGFRPKRGAHDALQVVIDESYKNWRWVVETDIADCFTAIPHSGLMSAVEERICDRKVLALLRALLRVGVMEDGTVRRAVSGTPQGGLCSAAHNPPCGVPLSRSTTVPSGSCSGAASHRFTYSSTQRTSVTASTALTTRSHGTESKNFWTSRSMTQPNFQHRCRHTSTASRADRFGR